MRGSDGEPVIHQRLQGQIRIQQKGNPTKLNIYSVTQVKFRRMSFVLNPGYDAAVAGCLEKDIP